MLRALNTSATGMASQEANVSTIANNIANANTVGFKQKRTEFEDLLYETVQEAGSRSSATTEYNVGTQLGSGSKVSATRTINQQGSPVITNNPFDLMINGQGYFGVITNNNQVRYTRDGAFNVDNQGNIVTKNGDRLFPGVVVPTGVISVNISESGNVDAYFRNQPEPTNLGQIPLFTFVNPAGLKSEGKNYLAVTSASGQPIQNVAGTSDAGNINQGTLEASNVSIMAEMTNLIKAQRAYEMNSKVMQASDQMLQTVNNIR